MEEFFSFYICSAGRSLIQDKNNWFRVKEQLCSVDCSPFSLAKEISIPFFRTYLVWNRRKKWKWNCAALIILIFTLNHGENIWNKKKERLNTREQLESPSSMKVKKRRSLKHVIFSFVGEFSMFPVLLLRSSASTDDVITMRDPCCYEIFLFATGIWSVDRLLVSSAIY